MRPISALAGVTLETPNLEAMSNFYTASFGLAPISKSETTIRLKGLSGSTPQLTLKAASHSRLVGITLAMRSREDIDAAAQDLCSAGVTIVEEPHGTSGDYQFSINDPDCNIVTFVEIPDDATGSARVSDRPLFISHVVLNSLQAPAMTAFYTSMLGFTVTDTYENGLLTFLRCDQPQHHCIGISPGESAGLNHFAMDCGNVDALMKSVGRMQRLGHTPIWGPGRHGPGGNIFCYYQDPDGFVPELTCDVLQIEDPTAWQPREWPRTATTGNTWGTGGPTPRAVELMSGVLQTPHHH
jgi:catechol 2,3-dioxygenase-like lactoylglutathione lyase family enzyme